MDKETKRVLKSWETSLERYGKIDGWSFNHDLMVLGDCLRAKEENRKVLLLIHDIRDRAICPNLNVKSLLSLIKQTLNKEENESKAQSEAMDRDKQGRNKGQDARFKSETYRIFDEKLRFKGGMLLRNFDIERESASDSKMVRRIVEKRMCQAYHRMNKRHSDERSNKHRYWEQRATAFQLYNIGQIENVENVSRGDSTHWKRMYDPYTDQIVLKKKMAYASELEALEAIEMWKRKHPFDKKQMNAYQCCKCHKWHIGHDNPVTIEKEVELFDIAS